MENSQPMARFLQFIVERLREKGAARMPPALPSRRSPTIRDYDWGKRGGIRLLAYGLRSVSLILVGKPIWLWLRRR